MTRLILTRLLTGIITLFLTAFFVFFAVQALPGDVATQLLGQDATPEAVETLRAQLGLDQNVWARFASWIGRSEEHTSELQSRGQLVCGLLLENKTSGRL